MKLFLSLAIGVTLIAYNSTEPTPRHNVFFAYNSSELSGSPARVVESVYEKLAAGKKIRFGITGPISNVHGIMEKNRINSERANNIVELLKRIGSDEDEIEIADVTNPYQPKPFDSGSNKPFELEVILTKAVGWVEPVFTSIDEYLPIPVQTFNIDPRVDNRLVGEKGTVINIPGNTLQLRNGTVPAQMTVELKEVYGGGTIVNANLHTNSGGKMLETGGTIHLDAHTNGSKAKVAYGEEIDLEFPGREDKKSEDMQLFKGQKDRNGNFDWIPRRRIQERTERSRYFINDKAVSKAVYDSTKAAWMAEQAEYERRMADYQAKLDYAKAASENAKAADAYLMSTDELGWINCDRFYDVEEKTDVIVLIDEKMKPSVRMVFDCINSVMGGTYSKTYGGILFSNVPVGESVRIVGYSIMDGTAYMDNHKVIVSEKLSHDLKLAAITKEQMEAELASLN